MVECPQRRRWFPPSHHGTDHEAHDEYLHCDPGFLGDMSGGVGPFMFCEPVLKLPLLHPHSLTLRHRPYDYEEIGNNDDDLVVVHRQTWICDGCGLERYHSGVYHCTECAFFDLCIGCSGQAEDQVYIPGLVIASHFSECRDKLIEASIAPCKGSTDYVPSSMVTSSTTSGSDPSMDPGAFPRQLPSLLEAAK